MRYKIRYSCLSHIGNTRSINQDNFICDGRYMDMGDMPIEFPLCGTKKSEDISVFGIFDGMGGEECGEIASYIASKAASDIEIGKDVIADLSKFCHKANDDICDYATMHEISTMGTTAAMLVLPKKKWFCAILVIVKSSGYATERLNKYRWIMLRLQLLE